MWDEDSKAHYFYDDETGATQWEKPDDFEGEVRWFRPGGFLVARRCENCREMSARGDPPVSKPSDLLDGTGGLD